MIWYDYIDKKEEIKISGTFEEYKRWLFDKLNKKDKKIKPLKLTNYEPIENSI